MKKQFLIFAALCCAWFAQAQTTLAPGSNISHVTDGNTIAYQITSVDSDHMTAEAMIKTSGTDQGSAELTFTIPENFVYEGYTVTPTSVEDDGWMQNMRYGALVLNSSITKLPFRALRYPRNLKSVDLKNVTSLGFAVFDEAPLESIDLTKVTYVGGYACRKAAFTTLHIPADTNVSGQNAFQLCANLQTITVEEGNPYVRVENNLLLNNQGLCVVAWGSDRIEIPASVTQILSAFDEGLAKDVYLPMSAVPTVMGYINNCQTRFHVPCSLMDDYIADATWKTKTLVGIFDGTIAIIYDTEKGDIQMIDTIDCESATAQAVAKAGYHFVKWSGGSRDAQAVVNISVPVTATFLENTKAWLEVRSANDEYGTVTVFDAAYTLNATENIVATPETGYHFVSWSDGNTQASRTITLTQDTLLTAIFDIDVPAIATILSADESMGTVTGSGTFRVGQEITITATAASEKYEFTTWSDGNTENPRNLILSGDTTITASFKRLLSPGDIFTSEHLGNNICYQIKTINHAAKTAEALIKTSGTDQGSADKTFTIPETVTYEGYTITPNTLEDDGWMGSMKYGALVMNSSITALPYRALRYARNLKTVDLKNVTAIGMAVFDESPLESIDLTNITSVSDMAFRNAAITSLHIPAHTSISTDGAFQLCANLQTITVGEGNPHFRVENNVLLDNIGRLCVVPWGSEHIEVPASVTHIISAFWDGLEKDVYVPTPSVPAVMGIMTGCHTRFHVLCSLMDEYEAADSWGTQDLTGIFDAAVTLSCEAEQGSIAVTDTIDCDRITIKATAKEGYTFSHWSDEVTDNPREADLSVSAEYTAIFKIDPASALDHVSRTTRATKTLEGGHLFIHRDGRIYDAMGQEINR